MADKHPYMPGSAGLVQAVNHLRKSFPPVVAAETLKKLGIAPNNETYVINILRFIKVLDEDGKKTQKAGVVFTKHDTAEFHKGLSEMVEAAYSELFSLHGKDSWNLPKDKLISFFRGADHSSAIVGQRQAGTFQALAALGGHGEIPAQKPATPGRVSTKKHAPAKPAKAAKAAPPAAVVTERTAKKIQGDMGLTVRIEINLPAAADKDTYDRIFKSIRENLLNAE